MHVCENKRPNRLPLAKCITDSLNMTLTTNFFDTEIFKTQSLEVRITVFKYIYKRLYPIQLNTSLGNRQFTNSELPNHVESLTDSR